MNFGHWLRLEAAGSLPAGPGVLQVRRERGLVDYPRGKSAMVHYAAADDLRAAALALAAAHPDARLLCRCNRDPVADPGAAAARLIADFTDRFGAAPYVTATTR